METKESRFTIATKPNRQSLIKQMESMREFMITYTEPPLPPQFKWVRQYQNEPVEKPNYKAAPRIWDELDRLHKKQRMKLTEAIIQHQPKHKRFTCQGCQRDWIGNIYQMEGRALCGACVVDRWGEYHGGS